MEGSQGSPVGMGLDTAAMINGFANFARKGALSTELTVQGNALEAQFKLTQHYSSKDLGLWENSMRNQRAA